MHEQRKMTAALELEVQALKEEMRRALICKGRSESTIEAYTYALKRLAEGCGRSPEALSDEDLRAYLLYEADERSLSASSINQKRCALRFFYEEMRGRQTPSLHEFTPRKRLNHVPVCLSHEEVKRALAAVRKDNYRAALALTYACGLRVAEVCAVRIDHVMTGQGMLLVRGKGSKQRTMPLPQRILEQLRENYAATRPPRPWMFANGDNTQPMQTRTLQRVFKSAVRASGVNPAASVHTLRHSYATTLLRGGVDVTTVQKWLGHGNVQTTMIYLHVVEQAAGDYKAIVNDLMSDL